MSNEFVLGLFTLFITVLALVLIGWSVLNTWDKWVQLKSHKLELRAKKIRLGFK